MFVCEHTIKWRGIMGKINIITKIDDSKILF